MRAAGSPCRVRTSAHSPTRPTKALVPLCPLRDFVCQLAHRAALAAHFAPVDCRSHLGCRVRMMQRKLHMSHDERHSWAMTLEATPRLITIGETMMMIAPARAESPATAQDVRLYAGGAESNVACHVAHAGLDRQSTCLN